MKIIDTFCFSGFGAELDLLELRFNELDNIVDFFVISEAAKTQSLLDKPFNFELNQERYKKFLSKIIYVKIPAEDCPKNENDLWEMEHFQRNCIIRGLGEIQLQRGDRIMISDLDEIPRASAIKRVIEDDVISQIPVVVLDCNFYAYFMNLRASTRNWVGTSIIKAEFLMNTTPQVVKDSKNSYIVVPNGGWHISWLGNPEKIWEKAHNCIEPYDKSTIPSKEEFVKFFSDFIKKDKYFFIKTENLQESNLEFVKVPLDDTYPEFVKNNLNIYGKYFIKE